MLRINKDDFKVLVCRVLIDPVRIEYPQVGTPTAYPFFGGGFKRALILELVHALVGRFACCERFRVQAGESVDKSSKGRLP